jgi:hypothetical protein
MADTKSTPEIVTEKDLEPVLRNTAFDSATFLRLYAEWKATKDPHTFAAMRTMHENAGYNNKNVIFGAEQEMHEIATIVQRYQEWRVQISQITTQARSTVVPSPAGHTVVWAINTPASTGTVEVREALREINPESLEKAVGIMESFINKVSDSQTKSTLRGVHGAIIFDILRGAGHNLMMQNGQITIIPKPGTDAVNLQEKLQTLVNTGRLSLESVKLGMLYSSPSFKAYSELKKTKDATGKDMIDPKASPQDFLHYLRELEKGGNTSTDIQSILKSHGMLQGVNMQQAIRGFQDLGQVGEWAERNEATLKKIQSVVTSGWVVAGAPEAPKSVGPTEPNTTYTGKLTKDGVTGGKVTGFVGDGVKGLTSGIGDIMSLGKWDPLATLGIGAVLAYGVYKAFQKFGFLGGFGALFGVGLLNNLEKAMGRLGIDVGDVAGKVKKAGEEAVVGAVWAVKWASDTPPPAKAPATAPAKTLDTAKLTPTQLKWYQWVEKYESRIQWAISMRQKVDAKVNGSLKDYIDFIHSEDFQNQKLSALIFTTDSVKSLFTESKATEFSVTRPANLDPAILKLVLRAYIGNPIDPSGNPNTADWGKKEKEDFLKKSGIDATWKDKTFTELITKVHA